MTDKTKTWKYVLSIESEVVHGTTYISCAVLARIEDEDHPVNFSYRYSEDHTSGADVNKSYRKGTSLEDLTFRGFLSNGADWSTPRKAEFLPHGWEYYRLHTVDISRAKAMAKTLERVYKAIEGLTEGGDQIRAVCKAFGITQAVYKRERGSVIASSYADNKWAWLSIEEGITRYRRLVADAIKESDVKYGFAVEKN